MKTSELFTKEIEYISNETLRKIVIDVLDNSPECIQIIPASSSGRYHPTYSLGEGGLMRHIKAAVGIAHSMIETEIFKNIALGVGADDYETIVIYKDIAYASLILHDCMKPDNTPKHGTQFAHPLLAAKIFKNIAAKYITNENINYMRTIVPLIHNCIASHMGEWNAAPYAKGIVLPKPKLGIEVFVHMCDYLANRKFLLFDFEVYEKVKR